MDTVEFLDRVLPPGNYVAVSSSDPAKPQSDPTKWMVRFYPRDDLNRVASRLGWISRMGWDAYHSNATFVDAHPHKHDALGNVTERKGSKSAANAQNVKAFWADLDVKRDGDKKRDEDCFATQDEAMQWLAAFCNKTGFPFPNVIVCSGYGFHVYWVMQDPMTKDDWAPYGNALVASLAANGFKGDRGISGDCARILRPIGTLNCKATPFVPVTLVHNDPVDFVNQDVLGRLQPFVGVIALPARATGTHGAAAPAPMPMGGNVSPLFAGQAPNMAAAAMANLPMQRDQSFFPNIAKQCQQVRNSLLTGGAQDNRLTWYLGHMSLLTYVEQGQKFIHLIGDKHPGYSFADTDKQYHQALKEKLTKNAGPPSCASYNSRFNPGGCTGCPFIGKITTPWALGVAQAAAAATTVATLVNTAQSSTRGPMAWPPGYQYRADAVMKGELDKQGNLYFVEIMGAGVSDAMLYCPAGGSMTLCFSMTHGGKTSAVRIHQPDITPNTATLHKLFTYQGLQVTEGKELEFRNFIMAWIDALRSAGQVEYTEAPDVFGWTNDVTAIACGATLYKDGARLPIANNANGLVPPYQPQGSLDPWKAAAQIVTSGRIELQLPLAVAFAAPLTVFSPETAVCWSLVSGSGVGKTAAMRVAQAVYASPAAMFSHQDTLNSSQNRIGQYHHFPMLWDEFKVKPGEETLFIDWLMNLAQGREKYRSSVTGAITNMPGTWRTQALLAGNANLLDIIEEHNANTNAAHMRIIEANMHGPQMKANGTIAQTLGAVSHHYGRAGEIYLDWLGANVKAAAGEVIRLCLMVENDMQTAAPERFWTSGVATALAGATFANALGLTTFNLPALKTYLYQLFITQRGTQGQSYHTPAGWDVERGLSSIMSRFTASRLVTDRFRSPGRTSTVVIKHPPLDPRGPVQIHTSQVNRTIRIKIDAIKTWCKETRVQSSTVRSEFVSKLGGVESIADVAGGTQWHVARARVIDIVVPHGSALEDYLMIQGGGPGPAAPPPPGTP